MNRRSFVPIAAFVCCLSGASLWSGCSVGRGTGQVSEERSSVSDGKIRVEAYLFDAVIRRNGKPTSIRLEVYDADSVAGLAGRAYLGKGALRGRLTPDSLIAYFPTTNEYVQDRVSNLASQIDCPTRIGGLNLLEFFHHRPDSLELDSTVHVTREDKDSKHVLYTVTAQSCPWQLSITYDRSGTGWRIRELDFFDGNRTSLRAERRELRQHASMAASRLQVNLPSDAVRVTP